MIQCTVEYFEDSQEKGMACTSLGKISLRQLNHSSQQGPLGPEVLDAVVCLHGGLRWWCLFLTSGAGGMVELQRGPYSSASLERKARVLGRRVCPLVKPWIRRNNMVSCPDCQTLEELLVLGNSNHNAEEMRRRKVLCFSLICISLTNRCVLRHSVLQTRLLGSEHLVCIKGKNLVYVSFPLKSRWAFLFLEVFYFTSNT